MITKNLRWAHRPSWKRNNKIVPRPEEVVKKINEALYVVGEMNE